MRNIRRKHSIKLAVCASPVIVLIITLFFIPKPALAQLPTRLVQEGDLVKQCSFQIPRVDSGDSEWVQGIIGYNPARNSLFLVGHEQRQQVAEFSIPNCGGTSTVLQPFRAALPALNSNNYWGGIWVVGSQLLASWHISSESGNSQATSHYLRSTDLSSGSVQGPFRVGPAGRQGWTSGYMAPIPSEWQSALGGDFFVGNCCLRTIGRTSFGPSIWSTNLSDLLSAKNPTNATILLGYPGLSSDPDGMHPLHDWNDGPTNLFNGSTVMRGFVMLPNTRSALFIGRMGLGPHSHPAGSVAPPYRAQVWAYDVNDLVAVKNGTRQYWDVQPYSIFPLAGSDDHLGGVAYDQAGGRIFVLNGASGTPTAGDQVTTANNPPTIHIYTLSGASNPPPPPTPASLPGDLNNDGIVNSLDWSIMNAAWFTSNANADLNHDGIVNSIDFSILNNNWFKTI